MLSTILITSIAVGVVVVKNHARKAFNEPPNVPYAPASPTETLYGMKVTGVNGLIINFEYTLHIGVFSIELVIVMHKEA